MWRILIDQCIHIYFSIVHSTLGTGYYISLKIQWWICYVQQLWQHIVCSNQTKGAIHIMAWKLFWSWYRFCIWCCTKVLQFNDVNKNKFISTIVFRLNLVWKTGYHSIGIITITQKIWNIYGVKLIHGLCCHSYLLIECVHATGLILVFVLVKCRNLCGSQK